MQKGGTPPRSTNLNRGCGAPPAHTISLVLRLVGSITQRMFAIAFWLAVAMVGFYLALASPWRDWNSARTSANEYDWAINDIKESLRTARLTGPAGEYLNCLGLGQICRRL